MCGFFAATAGIIGTWDAGKRHKIDTEYDREKLQLGEVTKEHWNRKLLCLQSNRVTEKTNVKG